MQSKIGIYEGYTTSFKNLDTGMEFRYRVVKIDAKANRTCTVDLEFEYVNPYGKVINSYIINMGQHNAVPLGSIKIAVRHFHEVDHPVQAGKTIKRIVLHFMHPMNIQACFDKKIYMANKLGEVLHSVDFGVKDVFNLATKSDEKFAARKKATPVNEVDVSVMVPSLTETGNADAES